MAEPTCCYCSTEDIDGRIKRGDAKDTELRPYGPGGAWVCYSCANATPERIAAARGAFGALLDAAESISPSGAVAIGEQTGPRPFDPADAGGVSNG